MCAPSTFCLTITKTTLKSATEKLLALSLYARIAVKAKIDSISRIMFLITNEPQPTLRAGMA
jgi:hypothetical protein